jgi:CRISPR-associated protein (TIGR02584 family)
VRRGARTPPSQNLAFVAGASPQIITETACVLARQGVRLRSVFVVTTETGRKVIERDLFGPRGKWDRLVAEYPGLRSCRFSPRSITVLRAADGSPLADVRSADDSIAAGDQILRFVAGHTRSTDPPLHASIAGGRKTMGYLLAAAMMLCGRRDDRLSHVLVHPPELEGTGFFFLPERPGSGLMKFRRADASVLAVAGSEVRLELADLPFPRLRALRGMDRAVVASFSQFVQDLQADLDVLTSPRLEVRAEDATLVCSGREVPLSPTRFAIYELLVERRKAGCGKPDCEGCAACFVSAADVPGAFREQLRERLRLRDSVGVGANWSIEDFRAERSKINDALARVMRVASDPYEIRTTGSRKNLLYGVKLDPRAITTSW